MLLELDMHGNLLILYLKDYIQLVANIVKKPYQKLVK